ELRIAQRRVCHPRVLQLGEAIGVVGEHRGAAEDQRAFAAPGVVDFWTRQDPLDELARLLVALAHREHPRGGEQQTRPAVELFGWKARDPVERSAAAAAR